MGILKLILNKIYVRLLTNEKYIDYLRKQDIRIGNNCRIEKDVKFGSEPYLISIGNNVRLTSNVQFITHDGSLWVLRNLYDEYKKMDKIMPIKIGNNVNVGWNTIIMPGVVIGDNVIIGAGSIITKDIPDNSIAAGVPAKIIGSIDQYAQKNNGKLLPTKLMTEEEKKKYLIEYYGLE